MSTIGGVDRDDEDERPDDECADDECADDERARAEGAGPDLDTVLAAVRGIPDVWSADILPTDAPGSTGTLRLRVADGADEVDVTRRVRTVLRAAFGLDVAHGGPRVVHGAHGGWSDDRPVTLGGRHRRQVRLRIGRVAVESDALGAQATVELAYGERSAIGRTSGRGGAEIVSRAVADATLAALIRLTERRLHAGIVALDRVEIGENTLVVLVVRLAGAGGTGDEAAVGTETLTGAVEVRGDERTAVVRAVLDAVNRWIGPLLE